MLTNGRLAPDVELLDKPYLLSELAQRLAEALEPS